MPSGTVRASRKDEVRGMKSFISNYPDQALNIAYLASMNNLFAGSDASEIRSLDPFSVPKLLWPSDPGGQMQRLFVMRGFSGL
jgi:hypothetical protein